MKSKLQRATTIAFMVFGIHSVFPIFTRNTAKVIGESFKQVTATIVGGGYTPDRCGREMYLPSYSNGRWILDSCSAPVGHPMPFHRDSLGMDIHEEDIVLFNRCWELISDTGERL